MAFQHRKPPMLWNVQIEVGGAWTTLEEGRLVTTIEAHKLLMRNMLAASHRIRMQPADKKMAGEFPAVKL